MYICVKDKHFAISNQLFFHQVELFDMFQSDMRLIFSHQALSVQIIFAFHIALIINTNANHYCISLDIFIIQIYRYIIIACTLLPPCFEITSTLIVIPVLLILSSIGRIFVNA
ncbi:MAG: hypothetical protein CVU11_00615 [Bacteroidetes bacterium HGW-Bacteroidetes-6]|jgi:hypothetical protein|nr:MAG: hypothetical protein CVU11_00615 [Bacteroidetes bacterium HGW-Bacteroidetes-6]